MSSTPADIDSFENGGRRTIGGDAQTRVKVLVIVVCQQVRTPPGLQMATFITRSSRAQPPTFEHVVRVLYAVTSADREFRPADRDVLRRAIEHVQALVSPVNSEWVTFSLHDPIAGGLSASMSQIS